MDNSIQNIFAIFSLGILLNACDGDLLFRTKACEDGMVRQGSACVNATKSTLGDCVDPDLNKLQKGERVTLCDGSVGEGKLVECSKDAEQNCVAKNNFKVVDSTKLDASKIARGSSIAGVTGTLRPLKQCRNYSSLATFDSSYLPSNFGLNATTFLPGAVDTALDQITFTNAHGLITNSPVRFTTTTTLPSPLVTGTTYFSIYVSNTVVQLSASPNGSAIDITTQGVGTHTANDVADSIPQYFDTIDDRNNGLTVGPTDNPWSSSEFLCNASNFVNVTSTSAPLLPNGVTPSTGNQPFTEIWQDQVSGMYISNILSVSGGRTWSDAVRTCESLNGGTAGDGWRLPTQKELMQLYIYGISKVALAGGTTNAWFWSSSISSGSSANALRVSLADAVGSSSSRISTSLSVICIR